MDDPAATTKPVINGHHHLIGMSQLNGAYKIDDEAAKSEILT